MPISTADFIKKDFGTLADQALSEPVRITKHGRDQLVMMSAAEDDQLKRRDRQVFRSEDLPDHVLELIAKAEVPGEFAHLDDEVKDWTPWLRRPLGPVASFVNRISGKARRRPAGKSELT